MYVFENARACMCVCVCNVTTYVHYMCTYIRDELAVALPFIIITIINAFLSMFFAFWQILSMH